MILDQVFLRVGPIIPLRIERNRHRRNERAFETRAEFVALREARDATLAMPRLIIPSLQVNMRAGRMPEPEDNGLRYLKVPLNGL